jgi:anion transporter
METTTIAIIITVVMIVLYTTEIIPLSITAVLSCLAMSIFGISSYTRAFSGFSNDILMMVAGMTVVSYAIFETGVAHYWGVKFITASIIITVIISTCISNTATAGIMFPIMAAAVASSKGKLTKKNSYMAVSFAVIAGGGCSLIGSTPQLLAQGVLKEGGYELMGFFELAWAGVPKVIILLVYFVTIGYALGQKVYDFEEPADRVSGEHINADGKFTPKMFVSSFILLGCVAGFIFNIWTLGTVAMLGGALSVVTRCANVKKMYREFDWETIILVAGSIGFANCLSDSDAGIVIANFVIGLLGQNASPLLILSALGLLAIIMGNIMTHTATTAILLPITVYIAQGAGIDVKSAVMILVIFVSTTYATPIMTPAATMSLAAGYRFKDYIKVGGLLNVISYIAIIIMIPFLFNI